MLFAKSEHIRKTCITDVIEFRKALVGWTIESSKNHYLISKEFDGDFPTEYLNELAESLSYCVEPDYNIVLKVAGKCNEETKAIAYVIGEKETLNYDTFKYCLSTRNGLKVLMD